MNKFSAGSTSAGSSLSTTPRTASAADYLAEMSTKNFMQNENDDNQIQIVNFDGSFNADASEWVHTRGISKCGFKFSVVTVLGCQSSGKSTLLNALFGTSFPEMNALEGRSQTTQGIWMSSDKDSSTLVVDVEGTDSKERGEDRLTFEHRASLFSLAIADAVIVNMWYTDLGRYTASNYGLLKTVLAVNLDLFQQEDNTPRTTLFFVIRDYSDKVTPFNLLEKMIFNDIKEIWKEIKKPIHLQDSRPEDFFTFVAVGLASKIVEPEKFAADVEALRTRWLTKERPDKYTRAVPADGFCFYSKSVWETILARSELDIPSQKAMVATFRCEDIKRQALELVLPDIQQLHSEFAGAVAEKALTDALQYYHKDAWRYQADVYEKKKEELCDNVFSELQKPLDRFLIGVRQNKLKEQKQKIAKLTARSVEDETIINDVPQLQFWENLKQSADAWRSEAIAAFDSETAGYDIELTVELDTEHQSGEPPYIICRSFDVDNIRTAYLEALDELTNQIFAKEVEAFRSFLKKSFAPVGDVMDAELMIPELTRESFWKKTSEDVSSRVIGIAQTYDKVYAGMSPTEQAEGRETGVTPEFSQFLGLLSISSLHEILGVKINYLSNQVHARFVKFFEVDAEGVPYQWTALSQDKIKQVYLDARQKCRVVVPIFSKLSLDVKQIVDPNALTASEQRLLNQPLMTEMKAQEITQRADQMMLKSCREAQFIQATGGRASSPAWWWWLIVLVLGWNELMAILKSPFFSIFVLMILGVVGFAYATGNMMLIWDTARAGSSFGLSVALSFLNNLQEGPHQQISAREISEAREASGSRTPSATTDVQQ